MKPIVSACLSVLLLLWIAAPAAAQDVVTQRNDNARSGAYLNEKILNPANVTAGSFGKLFTLPVEGSIFAQPLYLSQLTNIAGGTHNVVYVATMANMVYAFDADDGKMLWSQSLGSPVQLQSPCLGYTNYRDVAVQIGITSTPVISRDDNALWVIAITQDPPPSSEPPQKVTYTYALHKLDLTTGTGTSNAFASSTCVGGEALETFTGPFRPGLQNQRPGLLHFQNRVYAAFASYNDRSPFHGWVLGFNADTLAQEVSFNTTPSGGGGGIWMSGQGIAADGQYLYVMTGNGYYQTGTSLSNSFIKLNPDLELQDWFTPCNLLCLNAEDLDLAAGGAMLLPDDLFTKKLIVGGGKEGKIYVLDRDDMGKYARDERHIQQSFCAGGYCGACSSPGPKPAGSNAPKTPTCSPFDEAANALEPASMNFAVRGTPVFWDGPSNGAEDDSNPHIYVWPQSNRLQAYRFNPSDGKFSLAAYGDGPSMPTYPGGILAVSADGSSDTGILWATTVQTGQPSANQEVVPGVLNAYAIQLNPVPPDGSISVIGLKQIWHSDQDPNDALGNFPKFPPPVVANGKVYVATMGEVPTLGSPPNPAHVAVYGLKPEQ